MIRSEKVSIEATETTDNNDEGRLDAAEDELQHLQNSIFGHGWFDWDEQWSSVPLRDSYSDEQPTRKRTAKEADLLRIEVKLWSTVEWRNRCYGQVASELRKMASFLNERADEADRQHQRQHFTSAYEAKLQRAVAETAVV